MAVTVNPNPAANRVLLQVISQASQTQLTVALSPDEARRLAVELNHYATAVEPYGARLDMGRVVAVNGRGVE